MKKWKMITLSLFILFSFSISGTLAYLFDITPSFVNTFVYSHTGSLVIDKVIDHDLGTNYVIPDGIKFDFEIDFGSDYENDTVLINGVDYTIPDSGKIDVSIEKDGNIEIQNILIGTTVTVTEKNLSPGFSNEKLSQTITIEHINKHVLTFTNNYHTNSVNGSAIQINGKKQMDREWIEGDQFTFTMEYKNGEQWQKLDKKSVSYELGDIFTFNGAISNFEFTHPGIYQFKVYENIGNISGIDYSSEVYYIDVYITDETMDGTLEINKVLLNEVVVDNFECNITFLNTYAPIGSDSVTIDITKTLNDLSGQNKTPNGFKFKLVGDGKVYESNQTSSTGEASITVVYGPETAGKTFSYVLSEIKDDRNGYIYDIKEVLLDVTVVDNLDGTVSAYIYDPNGTVDEKKESYKASFTNTYDPIDADSLSYTGLKKLEGRELKENEFTFEMYSAEGELVATSKNNGEGSFTLQTPSFSKVGRYLFVIKEKQESLDGITYSNQSYDIEIEVADENGQLLAKKVAQDEIVFENTYTIKNETYTISGIKQLKNYELKEDMFTFEMYDADQLIRVAKNKEDGSFAFDGLVFTKDDIGERIYTIKEKDIINGTDDEIKRITMDDSVYNVKVEIKDNLKGGLEVTSEIYLGEQKVDNIKFVNTYTPAPNPVTVDVNIHKVVENKGTVEHELEGFTFVVKDEKGNQFTATTNELGKCIIPITLTEDNVGTQIYKVYEQQGTIPHMTYSDEEYELEVSVVINDDNTLSANVDDVEYEFINIYDYTPSTTETSDHNTIYNLIAVMIVSGLLLVLIHKRNKLIK